MVKGLELFREHFRDFSDRYVLIGGTACELVMNAAGLDFRATKDLDIVLCIETFDPDFARAFWAFIIAGQYQIRESAEREPRFYRFRKPADESYPAMLELFSRAPDVLPAREYRRITPIPVDGEISSLSAILLDEDYYWWVQTGKKIVAGLPALGAEHLIPLKVRAWLDLSARKESGEDIDRWSIAKHKNDVCRLFQVLDPEFTILPPVSIRNQMQAFLDRLPHEGVDLKNLGLRRITIESLVSQLRKTYQIG